jgi:arylsulfatase A-like enzyme
VRALTVALALIGSCALVACSQDTPEGPSFLLIVIDTLRADAVSAYGFVEGTTPTLDALAAEGTLYTNALAPSSWTVPSHATLFTGHGIDAHGVGVEGRVELPEKVETLAERFLAEGYVTGGISENMMVSPPFGMGQGFIFFRTDIGSLNLISVRPFDIFQALDEWFDFLGDLPYFLYLNIFDAHDPYVVRDENPYVPDGVDPLRVRTVQERGALSIAASMGICDALPGKKDIDILRGLYLGEVRAADAKVARILEALRARGDAPITVVTSDHGEHFGEHGLLGHEFSVRRPALHVPLIVHGAPLAPGRVDAPVTLADVTASLLKWGGLPPDAEAAGRPLPAPGAPVDAGRPRVAMFGDAPMEHPAVLLDFHRPEEEARKRTGCRPEHGVYGNLYALEKPPYKLVELGELPPQLYDLRWDPDERSNIARFNEEIVSALSEELSVFRARVAQSQADLPDPQALEILRSLGYLE